MTMLIFTAPLTRRFRFVSIVTILQQTAAVFVEKRNDVDRRRSYRCKKAEGSDGQPPAKELGNRCRFFATYAEV
jgi:hypothetical protein